MLIGICPIPVKPGVAKAKAKPTAVKSGFPVRTFNISTPPAPADWMQVEVPEGNWEQDNLL